jgi:uncharacterized membrane protein
MLVGSSFFLIVLSSLSTVDYFPMTGAAITGDKVVYLVISVVLIMERASVVIAVLVEELRCARSISSFLESTATVLLDFVSNVPQNCS